jgi:hypothetical protein
MSNVLSRIGAADDRSVQEQVTTVIGAVTGRFGERPVSPGEWSGRPVVLMFD